MCRISSTCPKFERRRRDGIKGVCEDCEYIKKEKRYTRICGVALIVTFVAFMVSTYVFYS